MAAEKPEGTTLVGADDAKSKHGYRVVLAGILAILVALGIVLSRFKTPADVAQVLGPVLTAIATIVGAFFGIAVGASGREQTTDAAIKAAAAAEPGAAAQALGLPRDDA